MKFSYLYLLTLFAIAPFTTEAVTVHDNLTNQLESTLSELDQRDQFSGAVLVAHHGEPLYFKVVGKESKEYGEQIKRNTKFNLGSASSLFPIIAVCQLIDKGLLKLNDPINQFINAKFLPKVNLSNIQVIHLLTGTSGLGDFYKNEMRGGLSLWERSNKSLYTTVNDYLHLARTETSNFTPGSQYRKSSTAILLLAAIVEDITKQDFYKYVDENIFEFAGMNETNFYTLSSPVSNIATGYEKKGNYWANNFFTRADRGSPAFGCYSTAEDLLKLFRAFYDLRLVGKELHDKILTPYLALSNPTASHSGVGPSNSYQGMLFELTYPNNDTPSTPSDTKLNPEGIKDLPSHHYIAALNSESNGLSVTIDLIEPTGYQTIVLSNYGNISTRAKESPSMRIATKVRRYLFNSIRNGSVKQPVTQLPPLPVIETHF